MAVQQKDLHARSGARGIAVGFAGGGPKCFMLGGERIRRAGLRQRCGAGQGAGLALQDLQIVIQIKDCGAFADCALMAYHHRVAVTDGHCGGR